MIDQKVFKKCGSGDDGTTLLNPKKRVVKNNSGIACCGELDELGALLGILLIQPALSTALKTILENIQTTLAEICQELFQSSTLINQKHIQKLEDLIQEINETLPTINNFITFNNNSNAAICNLARTVCRRAERQLITFSQEKTVNKNSLIYMNRLSDLLFLIARTLNT